MRTHTHTHICCAHGCCRAQQRSRRRSVSGSASTSLSHLRRVCLLCCSHTNTQQMYRWLKRTSAESVGAFPPNPPLLSCFMINTSVISSLREADLLPQIVYFYFHHLSCSEPWSDTSFPLDVWVNGRVTEKCWGMFPASVLFVESNEQIRCIKFKFSPNI